MKFITDPYVELPVSFKTVSEFRKTRTAELGDLLTGDNAVDLNQALPVLIQALPVPMMEIDQQNCRPSSVACETQAELPSAGCCVEIPTSYIGENTQAKGNSALTDFMSKAIDFETAFEYVGETAGSVNESLVSLAEYKSATQENNQNVTRSIDEIAESEAGEFIKDKVSPAQEPANRPVQQMATCDQVSVLDQAAVLRDPQETSSSNVTIEKDAQDRVVKSLFCGGEIVCFSYNDQSELVEFNYAGMTWTKGEDGWSAQDRQTEYSLDGKISVLPNGSIRIEREEVVRILKMSGTRIDEHKSGSRTESRKLKNKPSPYDLLAKAKAVSSIWLTARPVPKNNKANANVPAPLKLDLVNEMGSTTSEQKPMISSAAKVLSQIPAVVQESSLSCVPTTPIELRSLERSEKLRSLAETMSEPHRQQQANVSMKSRVAESWLKSQLWLTDRLAGQSSPKHLAQLDMLAQMYFDRQKNDLAELTHQRALHIREQFFGKGQPELATSVRGLAKIYEARGNNTRAEEMYKEAIELQENGLRKILFLYSEKVTDASKLSKQLADLFGTVSALSNLYASQGRPQLCAVVYEKALALAAEIIEREPSAEVAFDESVSIHMDTMKQLSVA